MSQPSADPPSGALEVLELLARSEPAARFQELLREARQAGPPGAELSELERAVQFASQVQLSLSQSQQREAGLAALFEISYDLALVDDPERLLHELARCSKRLLHLDMAYVALTDEAGATRVRTAEGEITPRSVGLRTGKGMGMGSLVESSGEPVWTADYIADTGIPHSPDIDAVVRAEGLHAVVAVPLSLGDSVLGTLYGADRKVRHFVPYEVSLLRSLGRVAAVAIDRVRNEARTAAPGADGSAPGTEAAARLIDLALGGADPEELVAAAARELRGAVVLGDHAGRVLALSGRLPEPPRGAEWARHARTSGAGGRPVPVGEDWVVPVTAGGEDFGFLAMTPATQWRPGQHADLLSIAARAVALALLLCRSRVSPRGSAGGDALGELFGAFSDPAAPAAYEVPAEGPFVVVVARPEGGSRQRSAAWGSAFASSRSGLARNDDGRVTLLLPGDDPMKAARTVARELSALCRQPVTVGAAGPAAGPDDVRRVHREAVDCLHALLDLGEVGRVATPRQLGFLGLLLSETRGVDAYIDSVIGPVLDYDARRFTDLTRTLDVYFASDASPTRAALSLHVHPNTVHRRLERVTELLGEHWQGAERSLDVRLALRLHRTRRALRGEDSAEHPAQHPPDGPRVPSADGRDG